MKPYIVKGAAYFLEVLILSLVLSLAGAAIALFVVHMFTPDGMLSDQTIEIGVTVISLIALYFATQLSFKLTPFLQDMGRNGIYVATSLCVILYTGSIAATFFIEHAPITSMVLVEAVLTSILFYAFSIHHARRYGRS